MIYFILMCRSANRNIDQTHSRTFLWYCIQPAQYIATLQMLPPTHCGQHGHHQAVIPVRGEVRGQGRDPLLRGAEHPLPRGLGGRQVWAVYLILCVMPRQIWLHSEVDKTRLNEVFFFRVNTKDSSQELVPLTNKGKRITALALNPTKGLSWQMMNYTIIIIIPGYIRECYSYSQRHSFQQTSLH